MGESKSVEGNEPTNKCIWKRVNLWDSRRVNLWKKMIRSVEENKLGDNEPTSKP